MNAIDRAYDAFCKQRFPLPSESQIRDVESRLGIALPADYRSYLLNYNGGIFADPDIVPPVKGCPKDALTDMYGVGAPYTHAEFASPADLALFDDNDPPQILPIGYTLMGNLLFLVTHPEEQGSVCLKKAFSDDAFQLASGIEEFFSLLRTPAP